METIHIEAPTHRSPVAEAMRKRHGGGVKAMRDRRKRRPKDARRHWSRESW